MMTIKLDTSILDKFLEYFENDNKFIECNFNFQISGKDDGEDFMLNDSASFIKDSNGNLQVSYNGQLYNLQFWLDGWDYDDANIDAIYLTTITKRY